MITQAYSFFKNHPATTGILGSFSGWLGVWLADVDQLASWSATLFSVGSFIIIAPKVWANVCAFARALRRALCRRLIWAIRKLRR